MKKTRNIFRLCLSFVLAAVLVLPAMACSNDPQEEPPAPPSKVLVIDAPATVIALGDDPIQLKATVTQGDDDISETEEIVWTTSDPTLLKVTVTGEVSALAEPEILDKYVTVTATLKSDSRVTAVKTMTVKAAKQSGQVGYLTSEMLDYLGNASITVNGELTDYYIDNNRPEDNSENKYYMTVEMQDGKWRGLWGHDDNEGNMVEDIYERGTDEVTDANGQTGYEMLSVYLDKNNKVAKKSITNYISIPTVWNSQHLWNHIGSLPVNDFTYEADKPDEYTYVTDERSEASMYLMTYLAYSLTPMMDETFQRIIVTLGENESGEYDHIDGIKAQTYPQYSGAVTDKQGNVTGYDSMSYSIVTFEFSKIGTTTVKDPEPYAAPDHVDALQKALDTMKTATNYTFSAVDTSTYAPSIDEGDYTISSVSKSASYAARAAGDTPAYASGKSYSSYYNFTSANGTVGTVGHVTDEGIVLMRTIEYSASMDDANFRTEVTGYKQITNNGDENDYYEQFVYSSSAVVIPQESGDPKKYGALQGSKSVRGHLSDVLPSFEFSPNLFALKNTSTVGGKTRYTFVLQSTSVTRDIAMEIAMDTNASNASASASNTLTIIVDSDGNLLQTIYPYSITSGTYLGYITTTYSKVGTTELREDAFNEYQARGWRQSWSEYTMKYYRENAEDNNSKEINALTAINSIFGSNANALLTPPDMMKLFGDDVSGPFYDSVTKTLADGSTRYIRYMSLTARTDEYDENSQISKETFAKIEKIATETFAAKGFKKDNTLSDTTGGATGRTDYYLVYDNGSITIVIQNNHTKNFWIYFYNSGDYTRSSASV